MINEQEATVSDQVAWDWRLSFLCRSPQCRQNAVGYRIISYFILQLCHNVLSIANLCVYIVSIATSPVIGGDDFAVWRDGIRLHLGERMDGWMDRWRVVWKGG